MRLSERLVVQYVNSAPAKLVFIDDATGREAERPATVQDIRHLMSEIVKAQRGERRWVVDGIEFREVDLVLVAYALGYFTQVVSG